MFRPVTRIGATVLGIVAVGVATSQQAFLNNTGCQSSTIRTESKQQRGIDTIKPQLMATPSGMEFYTEFFCKMNCKSCEERVTKFLYTIPGVTAVKVNLDNQSILVKGSTAMTILGELEKQGETAKIIGLSSSVLGADKKVVPAEFGSFDENTSCVAEFKGDLYNHDGIKGVVRLMQLDQNSVVQESIIDGLKPNNTYSLSIHMYGDTTKGAASTGPAYEHGNLGSATTDENGRLNLYGIAPNLQVWNLIGRAMVIHAGDDRVVATVIARSSSVGGNYKKLCTCDGTVIWDAK